MRLIIFAVLLSLSGVVNAATVAATLSGGIESRNSCCSYSLGWEFTVNQNITVTELGYYDAGQDGLAEDHAVGIFDASDNLLTSGVVTNSDSLENGFRYTDVTDVTLYAGSTYWMMGVTEIEDYWFSGIITTHSAITFVDSAYTVSSELVPSENTSVSVGIFGGNFKMNVVPVPGAVWLFGSALAGLGWLRRKQTV
jgi:hypothetical protein